MSLLPKHLPILMYHQILPKNHPYIKEHIVVENTVLQAQLEELIAQGWSFQNLKDWGTLKSQSNKVAILTFDDITSAFIDYALLVLQKLNVTATLFPIQNMMQGKPYLNLSPNGLNPLTENDLKKLDQMGFEIGSHGQSHSNMALIPFSQVEKEIAESKSWLESLLGHEIHSICYPIGGVNRDIVNLALKHGYKVGVTTLKGTLQGSQDDMVLRRINIKNDVVGNRLQYAVSPFYGFRRFIFRLFRAKYRVDNPHTVFDGA